MASITFGPYVLMIGRADARSLHDRFDNMERHVAALTDSIDALKSAVDGVAQRLLPKLTALEEALAAAQADDADAAALLADAETAAAAIRVEVDRLNALGADPTTPVDESAPDADTVPDVQVETGDEGDAAEAASEDESA
jgi:hypothetical protein